MLTLAVCVVVGLLALVSCLQTDEHLLSLFNSIIQNIVCTNMICIKHSTL